MNKPPPNNCQERGHSWPIPFANATEAERDKPRRCQRCGAVRGDKVENIQINEGDVTGVFRGTELATPDKRGFPVYKVKAGSRRV